MEINGFADLLIKETGGEVRLNEPLYQHTTWRVGGPADLLYRPASVADCRYCLSLAYREKIPVFFLGAGSNVLVSDEGLRGVVVQTKNLKEVSWEDSLVTAGTGLPLAALSQLAVEKELTGLEFAGGIPGSLGGAVFMNAGAYGHSIGPLVLAVKTLTLSGEEKTYANQELMFSYRNSILKKNSELAVWVKLQLTPGNPQTIRETTEEYIRQRKAKHPLHLPNAGSVFKNPPGTPAARLIEAVGAKGWRMGDAQVSHEHANFIVNLGQASADEIIGLIKEVQKAVKKQFSVDLETEVLFLGFDGSRR